MVQEDPGRTCSQPSRFFTHGATGTTTTRASLKKRSTKILPQFFRTTTLSQVIHSRDKPKPRDICGNYVLFSSQFLINLKKLSGDIMGYLFAKENCDAGSVCQTKSGLGKCPRTSVIPENCPLPSSHRPYVQIPKGWEQIVIVTVHPRQMTSMILRNPNFHKSRLL